MLRLHKVWGLQDSEFFQCIGLRNHGVWDLRVWGLGCTGFGYMPLRFVGTQKNPPILYHPFLGSMSFFWNADAPCCDNPRLHIGDFPLFAGGPYKKDCSIWGPILGSPYFGNYHITTRHANLGDPKPYTPGN